MLLSACETILGSHLHAIDGNIGCVRDLYVDDRSWEVEYVVIETRPWFPGRRVLVPAAALGRVNGRRRRVDARCSMAEVRTSPGPDAHRPVPRQPPVRLGEGVGRAPSSSREQTLAKALDGAWRREPLRSRAGAEASPARAAEGSPSNPVEDAHLYSISTLRHYAVQALDGEAGRVTDFLVEPRPWRLRHVVVGRGPWWRHRSVLLPVERIEWVSWPERRLHVAVGAEAIDAAPAWTTSAAISRSEEEQVEHGSDESV